MSDLIVPDISYAQGGIDHDELSAHFPAIIIRAGYGIYEDAFWKLNVAAAGKYQWWAAYWYINKDIDSASQARKFLDVIGDLQPNATIGDLEEGDGDQSGREAVFLDVLTEQGAKDFTYSGAWFTRAHNLQHVEWIAAYTNSEPADAHELWQFTSSYLFPGINGHVDASVFHGSIDDLIALTGSPNQGDDDMPLTDADIQKIHDDLVEVLRSPEFNVAHVRENTDAILARVSTVTASGSVDIAQLAAALHDMLKADDIAKLQAELAAVSK